VLDAVLDAVDGTAPDVATGRHATSADRIGTQPE
jgi:hypothetical protein